MAKTGCDKNCSTCDIGNRAFCAVQLGLKNQELLLNVQNTVQALIGVLAPLLPAQDAAPTSPFSLRVVLPICREMRVDAAANLLQRCLLKHSILSSTQPKPQLRHLLLELPLKVRQM